eukprot:TRINITY_DN30637_c0_g1_i1.p1 TRINITY_DN30637_c0_g1~~TRINITY_DN30637_c0_g1_i1.p1  ORF type:complete len:652 (-),score=96.91 TRINITY_DN30637_c0_g1_i1:228-2183(-)
MGEKRIDITDGGADTWKMCTRVGQRDVLGQFADLTRDRDYRATVHVEQRVGAFKACPIRLLPMFDPVRVIHEDEGSREGLPPHIMGREALERWFAADNGLGMRAQCPLCRGNVVRMERDAGIENSLAEELQRLAAEKYSGGENLVHKCVKLLDARLLASLSLHLSRTNELDDMLRHQNDAGQTPFDLLEAHQSDELVWDFLQDLPSVPANKIKLVHSEGSVCLGGSAFWRVRSEMRHVPVHVKQSFIDHDSTGEEYFVLCIRKMPEAKPRTDRASDQPPLAAISRVAGTWGIAVLLLLNKVNPHWPAIMICTIEESVLAGRDDGSVDENVFEPAIRIRADTSSSVFLGRVAALRGIWVGGTRHFDDFVLNDAAGAAALVTFDPQKRVWHARVSGMEGAAADDVAIEQGLTSRLTVARAEGLDGIVELTPGFTSRRMPSVEQAEDFLCSPCRARTFAEAERLRNRLMLVQIRAEVSGDADSREPRVQIDQLGAVVSEFIIGRQEGCSLSVSKPWVMTLSRSHCVLQLRETQAEDAKLFAYDDGSLAGTTLNGNPLGVGPQKASELCEGDSLYLGPSVKIHLRKVSRVLRFDDHVGLAAFFQRLGETETATSLLQMRPRRRATENLLSRSFCISRRLTVHGLERATTVGFNTG